MGKIAQKTLMAQTSSPSLAPSDERLSLIFSTMEIQVSNGMKQACVDYAQSIIVSKQVETFNNPHFGEIRIGLDADNPEEVYVSLALNHWEDDAQWGGQPLDPKLAREIGCVLIEYAAKAEAIQQRVLSSDSEMR